VTGRRMRVGVVGLGTMGVQAAWRLAARGADVVGFDRFAPGHDRGAVGGGTRLFRTGHFEDLRYLPIVRHADALWTRLETETAHDLRGRTGCLFVGPQDEQMRTLLASLAESGVDHRRLDAAATATRFPGHRLDDGEVAVLEPAAGFLHCELAVRAAALRAEQLGATLRRYVTVRGLEPGPDGIRVHTDDGTELVDAAVVTAGPWIGELLPDVGRRVEVRRLVNGWFVDTTGTWSGAGRPAFMRLAPLHSYGIPAPEGSTVKIGLSRPHHRLVDDPDLVDRTVTLDELAVFRELVTDRFRGLDPDPVRLSAFIEGYTADGRPLLGSHPGDARIVVAAGFSGHGFKWSPAIGDIAADLALTGRSTVPVEFLSCTSERPDD
jgi:sarcosine oxidase